MGAREMPIVIVAQNTNTDFFAQCFSLATGKQLHTL
jgi:hypothetical protein